MFGVERKPTKNSVSKELSFKSKVEIKTFKSKVEFKEKNWGSLSPVDLPYKKY